MITKLFKISLVCSLLWAQLFVGSVAAQPPASEYEIKAAFLFNFIKFVEWPPKAFTHKDAPYIIGLFGTDPFFDANASINYLDQAVAGKKINERQIVIRRVERNMAELKGCHLVYIHRTERNRIKEIVALAQDNNILTISEQDEFCEQGGIINFVKQSGKVRFEINLESAEKTAVKISSKLLNVAKIVATR